MRPVELWERRRFLVLPLLGLVGLVLGVAVAAAGTATNARGLELVGANDFDELTPTRNSEIALRGSFAYVGSLRPLPSLSTSGETLTIEESMNLEGENGAPPECWRRARMELRVMQPPAAKTSER